MQELLTRFWACLTTLVLVGGSIAAAQETGRGRREKAGDDPAPAAEKTDGGNAVASEPAGKDTESGKANQKAKTKAKPEEEFVRKTDAEWRRILTRVQYMVTRQGATEPAFSGKYATGHYRGTFLCVCCDGELFNAETKFDSGTGWPSFDRPANNRAIVRAMDYTALEPRVEVECRRCGAHLGHVFDDGPTITGLRFCINSAAIKLRPPEGTSASSNASTRTTSRASSKTRAKAKAKAKAKPKSKTGAKAGAKATAKSTAAKPSSDSSEALKDPRAADDAAAGAKPVAQPNG